MNLRCYCNIIKRNYVFTRLLDALLLSLFLGPLLIERLMGRKEIVKPRRILIIELWGIGDLVMMSPILPVIRNNYPDAKITLLGKSYAAELFSGSPFIDRYVTFDFPWTKPRNKYAFWSWDWPGLLRIIRMLRQAKFDLSFDARGDIRSNLLAFLFGAKRRLGYTWTGGGFFLTDNVPYGAASIHRTDAWLRLALHLGLKNQRVDFYLTRGGEQWAVDFFHRNSIAGEKLVVGIHPGAGDRIRCWPLDRFKQIGEHLVETYNATILIFADPDGYGMDMALGCGWIPVQANLMNLVSLIRAVHFMVCNDSGVMHIAAAVGAKGVAIFGPGQPARIGSYGNRLDIVMLRDVPCRPCYDCCRFKKPYCIDRISVAMVKDAVDRMMQRSHAGDRVGFMEAR